MLHERWIKVQLALEQFNKLADKDYYIITVEDREDIRAAFESEMSKTMESFERGGQLQSGLNIPVDRPSLRGRT